MQKYSYNFSDWENGYVSENAPPDSLLDAFPSPIKRSQYSPKWGKYSKSAEKGVHTRNHKRHLQNKEIFLREIWPVIENIIDDDSLFTIGFQLQSAEIINKSGFIYFRKGDRGSWLGKNDLRINEAKAMGCEELSAEEYFKIFP